MQGFYLTHSRRSCTTTEVRDRSSSFALSAASFFSFGGMRKLEFDVFMVTNVHTLI